MFDHFSTGLMRTIALSENEARVRGESEILPLHILVGLTENQNDKISKLLRNHGITTSKLIPSPTGTDKGAKYDQVIPLSEPAKNILALSYEECRKLNNSECGTEHLIMALLRDPDLVVLLRQCGVSRSKIEGEVLELLTAEVSESDTDSMLQEISRWSNRAKMARKKGNADLENMAIEHVRALELRLGRLRDQND